VNLNRNITVQVRIPRKRLVWLARLALFALPLLGWAIWLRPEFAGGHVGYIIVGGKSMQPTLRGGDLAIVQRKSTYRPGDIVAYHIPDGLFRGRRIIHRIVGGDPVHGFVMRGDNNADDDLWYPRQSNIEGKLWKRLPVAGRVVAFARAPAVLAAVAGGFVFALVLTLAGPQRHGVLSPATGLADGPSARDP
jgi:signal peptidase I